MKIIRVEDGSHHGPYYAATEWELMQRFPWVSQHNDMKTHPDAQHDGIGNVDDTDPLYELMGARHSSMQFGFSCLDQFYRWFTWEQRVDLVAKGYRVLWVTVPDKDIIYGGHQCVFHRATAKITGPVEEVVS